MTSLVPQDIFQIKCLIENINIKLSARCENGVKQLLAVVTSDNEIILHYTYGELVPILKRIPWFTDGHKQIQAICFDSSATWLLAVCIDSTLFIVPALYLVDKKQKIDCKWSLTDLTSFPKHAPTSESKATSCVWWQTYDCNQNAIVGFENGAIVLFSLTDGRCLASCNIPESVKQLFLCQDNSLETVSLLINGESGQQWRLILEHHSTGYLWPPEINNQADDSTRSRLYNLKQLGVDKLASLKQRLSDARGTRRDSQNSDTASESSHSESIHSTQSGPELLPHLCDTFFAPQYARNRYLFSAFYKPTRLLTVHAVDVESAPLFVHRLPPKTNLLLLTDKLIFTINDDNTVSIVSSQLSECRLEGDTDFNDESLVAEFLIENKTILQMYKLLDLSSVGNKTQKDDNKKDKLFELPKSIDDLNLQHPRVDTCVIVTDSAVYQIVINCSPVKKFVQYVTEEDDLEKAEKLSCIFGLNLQQLLESCGDLMISKGSYHSGIILYKQAKVHLLKRVLKLAVCADCKTLLKFVHLCLSASKVDMSIATKIHIGNLAVMAYTELILRYGGAMRVSNTKDFMNFLCFEEYYDQILAVNVACQAGHWNVVTLLAKSRGLQFEVVAALGQILQSARAPKPTESDFLFALSEPSLTQSLLVLTQSSEVIFQYIRTNVDSFPIVILKRLTVQLDPSQPCVVPLACKATLMHKISSSMDTTIDSVDYENTEKSVVIVKDMIETFLVVNLYLIAKSGNIRFDLCYLKDTEVPEPKIEEHVVKKLPDLHPLSCGYEHAAVIRNSKVYTMGVSSSGCLGLGPLLTHSSPPRLVTTLSEMKVKALSVSCGRKHTICLTDYGVYVWGSNTYGQLGLGPHVQESPYSQILSALSSVKVINIAAGQYHSVALTSAGKVYTWGWGIHGQLGHGSCDNEFYPRVLNFPHPVKQVAAGHAHTIILTCDGKLFGFGSNVFGQLESWKESEIESTKIAKPIFVPLLPDIFVTIDKIASSYFHNVAIRSDQEVFVWGATPQEVRIFQSKNNQKIYTESQKSPVSWRNSVHIYTPVNKRPIEQVSVGYRHTAILHNGKILWGKNKSDELTTPKLREQDNLNSLYTQKFLHVACGVDYTMAIDRTGKVLAWGSASMAQTILGRHAEEEIKKSDGKVCVFKNTRRVIKFPNAAQNTSDSLPIEVPGLPSMAITFNTNDHRLLFWRNFCPYSVFKIENEQYLSTIFSKNNSRGDFNHLFEVPNIQIGPKTLHYALQTYYGLYDVENVLLSCLNTENLQAASKVALLDGHFSDSLTFQLHAFKKHIESLDINLNSIFTCKDSYDVKEKEQGVELIIKNIKDDFAGPKSSNCNSPAHILSSSSSLDSLRQWGDEGGRESPCDMGDIRQNITQYVQSLKLNESPPISSVSKMVSEIDNAKTKVKGCAEVEIKIKDKTAKDIIDSASFLIEFYIRKIYLSENHILMQNVLMKSIEFWLSNNLPVGILENILLKNLDKYFYPLSILLFCKNFDDEVRKDEEEGECAVPNSSGFLKEFSTKFCLQLCSMVLENANKM